MATGDDFNVSVKPAIKPPSEDDGPSLISRRKIYESAAASMILPKYPRVFATIDDEIWAPEARGDALA